MTEKQIEFKNKILKEFEEKRGANDRKVARGSKPFSSYPITKKVLETEWNDENFQILVDIFKRQDLTVEELNHFFKINNIDFNIF